MKDTIIGFVDNWEPKASLLVLAALLLAAFFTHIGSSLDKITDAAAHAIDTLCFCAAVLVGVLQVRSWTMKLAPPCTYDDPKRGIPKQDESASGLVFRTESLVGYPRFRFFVPERDDLEYFVKWSSSDPTIADASNIKGYQRRLLYESWYNVNPKQFLILQSQQTFGGVWETVALSIILDIPKRTLKALRLKKTAVVDLREPDLALSATDRSGQYLLYDTLIFSPGFREKVSEFKRWHSLFHLSQFPSPTPETPVTILVEPDNLRLHFSIQRGRYGHYKQIPLVNNHVLFQFDLPGAADQSKRARNLVYFWNLLQFKRFEIPTGCPRKRRTRRADARRK